MIGGFSALLNEGYRVEKGNMFLQTLVSDLISGGGWWLLKRIKGVVEFLCDYYNSICIFITASLTQFYDTIDNL